MKKSPLVGLLCIWMSCSQLMAQPDTDIYLLDLSISMDEITATNPQNITRRNGYDNQPSFTQDGSGILYASIPPDGRSDIFRYDINSRSTTSVISTKKTSEYSPVITPDGKYISVVQESPDSTQLVVLHSLKKNKKKILMPNITKVGYYTWYHKKRVAMFLLGDSFTLQASHVKKGKLKMIADNIGRSVHTRPILGTVSFVDKSQEKEWFINEWNPKTGITTRITQTLPEMEDYCWTPYGTLLMGKGSKLYSFDPEKDTEWQLVGDLGIGNFYRLTVSPKGDKLAVVVYQDEMP